MESQLQDDKLDALLARAAMAEPTRSELMRKLEELLDELEVPSARGISK